MQEPPSESKEVRTSLSPEEVRTLTRSISRTLGGIDPDPHGVRPPFWSAVAHSLYSSIHEAFLLKSKHGADELGNRWAAHKLKTKAYSRKDYRQGLALPGTNPRRPTLTPEQERAWRFHYAHTLAFLRTHESEKEAKQGAGRAAWSYVKEHLSATTLLELTASKELALLKVSGRLLQSLTPSPLSPGDLYQVTVQEQVFIVAPDSVTIGSSVPYASRVASSRPLWPVDISPWLPRALRAGRQAIINHLARTL